MNRYLREPTAFVALGLAIMALAPAHAYPKHEQTDAKAKSGWNTSVAVDKQKLGVVGTNPYFILTPGYTLIYKHGDTTDRVTVLSETRMIDGVKTRVLLDREFKGGSLVEQTRDYYAIDKVTGDVYYFGEDVNNVKNGKVVGHEGVWHSGVNGAHFGLMMPANPRAGMKYYQEWSPGIAMDRAEILPGDKNITTPAGDFAHAIGARETTPLEPGVTEYKWYARGVGPVMDDNLRLVKHYYKGKTRKN